MYFFALFVVGGAIFRFKERIKQRLAKINSEINRLKYDNQWNTPLAILLTAFLTLSGTLWFLAICQMIGFFFVKNPTEFWDWSFSMAGSAQMGFLSITLNFLNKVRCVFKV